jgi:hypothetical protein
MFRVPSINARLEAGRSGERRRRKRLVLSLGFFRKQFQEIFEKELASRNGINTVSPPFRKEAGLKVGDAV